MENVSAIVPWLLQMPNWLQLVLIVLLFLGGIMWILKPIIEKALIKHIEMMETVDTKLDDLNTRFDNAEADFEAVKEQNRRQFEQLEKQEQMLTEEFTRATAELNGLVETVKNNQRTSDKNDLAVMCQKVSYLQRKSLNTMTYDKACLGDYVDMIKRINSIYDRYYKVGDDLGFSSTVNRINATDHIIQNYIDRGELTDNHKY